MANQVRVGFGVTGANKAASDVDRLREKFDKLQKTSAKGLAIGAGAAVTAAGLNLVGNAIRGVTDYLGDSAEAYREDIKSQAQLRTSLAANDTAYRGNARAIEDVLEKRIDLGFSDDEQRSSLAALTAITKDGTKALEIQRTAMDLARLKGMDLAAATELLGKVAGGNIGILARYGIQLKKGSTATEALAEIQKMAAGQADAWATSVGKTEVAQIKAAEASEKFGKVVDKLQGIVMPAATGVIEGFAAGLDALQTQLDPTASALDKVEAEIERLRTGINGGSAAVQSIIATLERYRQSLLDAATAESQHGDALIGVRQNVKALPALFDNAADAFDDLTDAEKDNIKKSQDVADTLGRIHDIAKKLPDVLDDLTDSMFGDAQRTGDLAEARRELADLLETEPTKGTRAWKIWAGDVAEAKQSIFELQYQMKQAEGPEALDAWLRKSRDALGKTDQKARDYYNSLIAINSINLVVPKVPGTVFAPQRKKVGGGYVPLAEGGIVPARPGGTLALLGEGGRDEAVVPLNKSSGMGGSITNNFYISGVLSMTPGANEDLARKLEPIISRAMQRRGLLGAARAF